MESLVNITLDGKPFEKLIEVVGKGIGAVYLPRKIRKEADARAYEIKVIEEAKAFAASEAKLIAAVTDERIAQRLVAKEIRRQENIDSVVEMAAKNLEGKTVSDRMVDEDWATRFFDIVQDVSKSEMKVLWAKILSKEIEKPTSYSLRTLEILRNITFEEAELFRRLSDFVLKQGDCFVFDKDSNMDRYGLCYNDLAKLRESGLLQSGESVFRSYMTDKTNFVNINIVYRDQLIHISLSPSNKALRLPIFILTQAGCEIYELIDVKYNWDYINSFASFIKTEHPGSKVLCGTILRIEDDSYICANPMKEL